MNYSNQRLECNRFIENWVSIIEDDLPNHPLDVLEIGIAGDEKPGGNYRLFKIDNYQTSDIDPRYEPDYTFDLCDLEAIKTLGIEGKFDIVVCSNTIEHIYDTNKAMEGLRLLLKGGGYLILDCPWMYPYHPDDDFDDYWRISASAMKRILADFGFFDIKAVQGDLVTSSLSRKAL
jgi:SAM-dependent methyltransferase